MAQVFCPSQEADGDPASRVEIEAAWQMFEFKFGLISRPMCGICGIVRRESKITRFELEQMNRTLRHRGPDDEGIYLSTDHDTADTRKGLSVGLAMTRLAVIDLSPAGHQPMSDPTGETWIVFNGEIYNYRELRAQLMNVGVRFHGDSDTEVILAAYQQWGIACVHHLVGMFAFALHDRRNDKCFLVRDRLGKKPLYYYWESGLLLFGSELKALRACDPYQPRLDPEALAQYFLFQYIPQPLSIYQKTCKLQAGHYLCLARNREPELVRYWSVENTAERPRDWDEGEAEREAANLASEAVRLRMISDVPLGAFLSGGIDSSLIVALMQQHSATPVKTFTIGFGEADFDESQHAAAVANHLGTDHQEMCVSAGQLLQLIPTLPQHYDEPFADSSALPTLLVSKLARQEVTVALTGDGGDELFYGYDRYRWMDYARMANRLPTALLTAVAAAARHVPHDKLQRIGNWLQFRKEWQQYLAMVSVWRPDEIERLLNYSWREDKLRFPQLFTRYSDPRQQLMNVDIQTYLVDDILTKVDRASMAFSLEVRSPLLDHRLVELVCAMPGCFKYRRSVQKYLIKKLLSRYLPARLIARPKQGFAIPLKHWLRSELKWMLEEYLNPARLRREGILNEKVVANEIAKHASGRFNRTPQIWSLLMFQMWRERWG